MKRFWVGMLFVLAGGTALWGGVTAHRAWMAPASPEAAATQALLKAPFRNLQGQPQRLLSHQGKYLLVNFWATWCEPCREEMPDFDAVHAQLGTKPVVLVGVAIDQPDKVQAFLQQVPVRYLVWLGDERTLDLVVGLGNKYRGLPFTVLVDPQGRIQQSKIGKLERQELQRWLDQVR